jgi:hypothetical protein
MVLTAEDLPLNLWFLPSAFTLFDDAGFRFALAICAGQAKLRRIASHLPLMASSACLSCSLSAQVNMFAQHDPLCRATWVVRKIPFTAGVLILWKSRPGVCRRHADLILWLGVILPVNTGFSVYLLSSSCLYHGQRAMRARRYPADHVFGNPAFGKVKLESETPT